MVVRVFALISILFSLKSLARVQFEDLDSQNILNSQFRHLVEQWERDFNINDAGVYGFQVKELNQSETWDKIVRNIFYITSYCHDEKETREIQSFENVFPITKRLINDMAYLELNEPDVGIERLASKYSRMIERLHRNSDFLILDGFSVCDSMYSGFSEITIIDKLNFQYVVLYGGYTR